MGERTVMQVLNAALRGEVTAEQAADELASPYRRANAIVPRADGRQEGPSVLARIGAVVLPRFLGARWRWYRRATGGRWAREWSSTINRWFWREWPRCPLVDATQNFDARSSECAQADECHCEEWP